MGIEHINQIPLESVDYGAALNERLLKIQNNFEAIIQSEYLKGAPGNNTVTKSVTLTNSNPNDGIGVYYLTNNSQTQITKGYLFTSIENAIKSKWGIDVNETDETEDPSLSKPENSEVESWNQDLSGKEIILITEQVSDRLILKSIVPFTHIDLRFYNSNISENPLSYKDLIDTSCSIHYDTGNGFVALSSFPTLYYDSNVGNGNICWKINGQETGMVAQGPTGKDAVPFVSYLCQGILEGDGIKITSKWDLNTEEKYDWILINGKDDLPEGSQCFVVVQPDSTTNQHDLYIVYPTWDVENRYFVGTTDIGIQNNWSDAQFEQCMLNLGQNGAAEGLYVPIKDNQQNLTIAPYQYNDANVHIIKSSNIDSSDVIADIGLNINYKNFKLDASKFAIAEGLGTLTNNEAELACGKYNDSTEGVTLFSVGNGESDADRKNAFEITSDGDIYIGQDKNNENPCNYPGENGVTLQHILSSASNMEEIIYSELKGLRDNNKLTPGKLYRIIDYITTTSQTDTISVGHLFDIIVLALSENKLSEEAWAIHSVRDIDEYFANSKLEAWMLWYCLDNDTDRFMWADTDNGKGVIYRMIDEFNNDLPYDFKNIKLRIVDFDPDREGEHGELPYLYPISLYPISTEGHDEDASLYYQNFGNKIDANYISYNVDFSSKYSYAIPYSQFRCGIPRHNGNTIRWANCYNNTISRSTNIIIDQSSRNRVYDGDGLFIQGGDNIVEHAYNVLIYGSFNYIHYLQNFDKYSNIDTNGNFIFYGETIKEGK